VIPPDPPVFFNLRPEPFRVDETDWLTTMSGDRVTTVSGDPITTDIPNPEDAAIVSSIVFSMRQVAAPIQITAFIDLFGGNPAGPSATSVLAAITGSSSRPNIASQLSFNVQQGINALPITVAAASLNTTNVTHAALYTAAAGGTRLLSGPVSTV